MQCIGVEKDRSDLMKVESKGIGEGSDMDESRSTVKVMKVPMWGITLTRLMDEQIRRHCVKWVLRAQDVYQEIMEGAKRRWV